MGAGKAAREGPQGPPPGALKMLQHLAAVPDQFKELPTGVGRPGCSWVLSAKAPAPNKGPALRRYSLRPRPLEPRYEQPLQMSSMGPHGHTPASAAEPPTTQEPRPPAPRLLSSSTKCTWAAAGRTGPGGFRNRGETTWPWWPSWTVPESATGAPLRLPWLVSSCHSPTLRWRHQSSRPLPAAQPPASHLGSG